MKAMAFLKINGLEIPIDINAETEISEKIIGERKNAFDGTLLTSINNFRRTISVNTAALSKADADVVIGLVQGLGEHFTLDDDLYSSKGTKAYFTRDSDRYLTDATAVSSGVAGYEPSMFINTISTDMKCIWVEEGTENLLSENQATANTSSTGAAAGQFEPWGGGAEITKTTSGVPWEGDTCLYLEISSGVSYHGVRMNNGTQDGGYYTGSMWLKGSSDSVGNVFLSLWDGVAAQTIDSDVFALEEDWTRYDVTGECTSGTIYLYLRNGTTGLVKCFMDGFQLE